MKKYLMTGIAALALCAGFTSCSHDLDSYSPEEIQQLEAQKIVEKYNKAFEATFGKPKANHNWGFGPTAAARTRGVDVNHNQWYNTGEGIPAVYGTLEEDPVVTDEERIGVFTYMNKVDNRVKTDNIIWNDYFVSQVWDGGTNYILNGKIYGVPAQDTNDPTQYTKTLVDAADGLITENGVDQSISGAIYTPFSTSYAKQDGTTVTIPGGDKMDYLFVNETGQGNLENGSLDKETGLISGAGGWTHINNFNSANCPDPWYAGKTWMTKDENGNPSGTYDFAYNQSDGSYFSHKYLIISGEEIFAGNQDMLDKYGDFYYVCFDFEKPYTDAEKAKEETFIWVTPYDNNGAKQNRQKVQVKGYYTDDNMPSEEQMNAAVKVLNSNYTSYETTGDEKPSVAGYLYGDKHFAGDNNYTDWIVRISPANYKNTPPPATLSIRVMAEDLSVTDPQHDFDFNDVVFDVIRVDDNNAQIILQAAGGTLPLKIGSTNGVGGFEVHAKFGVETNVMVNTRWQGVPRGSSVDCGTINIDGGFTEANFYDTVRDDIRVEVEKTGSDGVTKTWVLLSAPKDNSAPSKFGCPIGTDWVNERVFIDDIYNFSEWVTGADYTLEAREK